MSLSPLLHRAYSRARDEHRPVELAFAVFAARVRALARAEPRAGRHFADLYLAIACDLACPGALERFLALHPPRLRAFLARSGVGPARASGLLDDLHADLATPPPDRRARTRFGTYTGAASLHGWLTAILLRRRADAARKALVGARACGGDPSFELDAHATDAPGPLDELIAREAADVVTRALCAAHTAMTERERAFLACRIDGALPQREIARRLGVGAPRVSRLGEQALAKLRRHVLRDCAAGGLVPDTTVWPRMRDSVGLWFRATRAADRR